MYLTLQYSFLYRYFFCKKSDKGTNHLTDYFGCLRLEKLNNNDKQNKYLCNIFLFYSNYWYNMLYYSCKTWLVQIH